ncbi:hypothetical protein J6590_092540, partial [Homalodisca vitripennis]
MSGPPGPPPFATPLARALCNGWWHCKCSPRPSDREPDNVVHGPVTASQTITFANCVTNVSASSVYS